MFPKNTKNQVLFSIVIVIFLICGAIFLFLKGNFVTPFSTSATAQKQEYEQQKAIARQKYGDVTSSESSQKKASSESTSSSSTKQTSSSETTKNTADEDSESNTNYTTYIVKSGDTLSAIATKYNLTVDELSKLNDLESKVISVGQALKVPVTQNQTE